MSEQSDNRSRYEREQRRGSQGLPQIRPYMGNPSGFRGKAKKAADDGQRNGRKNRRK